jgi:hypothetical protein
MTLHDEDGNEVLFGDLETGGMCPKCEKNTFVTQEGDYCPYCEILNEGDDITPNWKDKKNYGVPKDCPGDYQGVGDDTCFACELNKVNRCPYLEPEMMKVFNAAIQKKRMKDRKAGNCPEPWITFDAEHLRKYLDSEIKEWAKVRSAVEESATVSDEERGELIDIINLACFIVLKK